MKVDQLIEAIENIDDRYIEESAYGVRRKSNIPWGMIITAACFCLVIGVTIFMQGIGILPHLNGTSDSTSQPVTTEPSNTTEPFRSEPDLTELQAIDELFQDRHGWYYRALVDTFASPKELHLRYYFYNSTELGEGLQPTKAEMDELMELMPDGGTPTLVILPVSKMDTILTEVFGITVAEMESAAFAGLRYVESIDSWCFWGGGTLNTPEIITRRVTKESKDIFRVTYRIASAQLTSYELILWRYEDSYYIQSNAMIESAEPPETTAPTVPVEKRPSVEEFFSDRENWQNHLILATFSDPTQIDLRPSYLRTMGGEITYATDLEHEKLSSVVPGYDRNKLFRATKAQLDEVMLTLFNIATDQLTTDWEQNFTYLTETGCYYGRANSNLGYTVYIDRTEDCDDGTILMYYALAGGEDPDRVARLQPHETGYYILSNGQYVDNTGKSEEQIAMETLFKASGWYNQALTCEYDSPEQIGIKSFFYRGFSNEPKATDAELAQLKNMQGFGTPAGDICRLPPDKMNAVLTECFGITLENVDPTGFNGLAYLKSTNCYYFKASAPNSVGNFKADKVEEQSDGTIDIYYNVSYKGDYVVTIKPHGDGYRILSNRCINSTPLIPPTPTEPTGDTELEKLFANYGKMPEKELSQKMVDAFLADQDTFVQLLAKQERYHTILGVLSRNVTDNHPQIGAYRATVINLLAKELPEKEKNVVYGMAVYSGLSNYIPDAPTAADYRMILDMMDNYSYEGETAELLRKFCIQDTAGVIAAMAQDKKSQTLCIACITALASQEELEQIKENMNQYIEEHSVLDGEGIQDRIKCAQLIVESCDKEIG